MHTSIVRTSQANVVCLCTIGDRHNIIYNIHLGCGSKHVNHPKAGVERGSASYVPLQLLSKCPWVLLIPTAMPTEGPESVNNIHLMVSIENRPPFIDILCSSFTTALC